MGELHWNSVRLASHRHARTNKSMITKVSGRSRVSCGTLEKTVLDRKCISSAHSPPIASFGGRRERKHRSPVLSLSFRLSTDAACAATTRGSVKKTIIWHCMKLKFMEMFALAVNLFITTSRRLSVVLYEVA